MNKYIPAQADVNPIKILSRHSNSWLN